MRTLVITSSYDSTTDLIIGRLGSEHFIRLNYDRPTDWIITLTDYSIAIESDSLRITDEDIAKCIWRKPFMSKPDTPPYDDSFYSDEYKYLLYEIFFRFHDCGKARLNSPAPDYLLGKMRQQRAARKYFKISEQAVTINKRPITIKPVVAKSLANGRFSNGNVLYTTDVTGKNLDSHIWFLQDQIIAKYDLTVVYLYGDTFGFSLDRSVINGLDWRRDQLSTALVWAASPISDSLKVRLNRFMTELGLSYGRLDFLTNDIASEPIFLEVNKNGQWAWLDPHMNNGLFDRMRDVFDPRKP